MPPKPEQVCLDMLNTVRPVDQLEAIDTAVEHNPHQQGGEVMEVPPLLVRIDMVHLLPTRKTDTAHNRHRHLRDGVGILTTRKVAVGGTVPIGTELKVDTAQIDMALLDGEGEDRILRRNMAPVDTEV